jgi:hypothetical protein
MDERPQNVYHTARFKAVSSDGTGYRVLCGRSPVPCSGLLGYASLIARGDEPPPPEDFMASLIYANTTEPGQYWIVLATHVRYSRDSDDHFKPIKGKLGPGGKRLRDDAGRPLGRAAMKGRDPHGEHVAFGEFPAPPAIIHCPDCLLAMWVPIPPCANAVQGVE